MLVEGFYTVATTKQISENEIHVTVQLHEEHPIFEGHFPGNPVTPGVCMIQIIKEIVQEYLNMKLFIKGISNVKFTALINPNINAELLLELSIVQIDGVVKVKNISKFVDGTIALKYNSTFIER